MKSRFILTRSETLEAAVHGAETQLRLKGLLVAVHGAEIQKAWITTVEAVSSGHVRSV